MLVIRKGEHYSKYVFVYIVNMYSLWYFVVWLKKNITRQLHEGSTLLSYLICNELEYYEIWGDEMLFDSFRNCKYWSINCFLVGVLWRNNIRLGCTIHVVWIELLGLEHDKHRVHTIHGVVNETCITETREQRQEYIHIVLDFSGWNAKIILPKGDKMMNSGTRTGHSTIVQKTIEIA